jgi:hypothetical protein
MRDVRISGKSRYASGFPLVLALAAAPPIAAADDLAARYRELGQRVMARALADEGAWRKLEHVTTRIGHRLSGSPGLEQAIAWASAEMRAEGLEGVRLQPAKVPRWVRGRESLRLVAPVERELPMLGLGMSVGTPAGGLTAPLVAVRDEKELQSLGREKVQGRIVVYAADWEGYNRTVRFRSSGASEAAKLGAVAALVRSATGRSIASPHTGSLTYAEGVAKIPAAAITVEDAMWLRRMASAGETLTATLAMEARLEGEADSWDVGEGAHDDACSCMAAWRSLVLLKDMGLRPRRTLRVVLFTNEENGIAGGKAYHAALAGDFKSHAAAIEMDGGCERPAGFGITVRKPGEPRPPRGEPPPTAPDGRGEAALATVRQIASLFAPIDATAVRWGGGGADISPLMAEGVPGLHLNTTGEHYFDWHHSHGDTLDKVEPADLQRATFMLAVMGYVLADMPGRLAP